MKSPTILRTTIFTLAAGLLAFGMTSAHAGSGTGRIIYFVSFITGGEEAFVVRLESMQPADCADQANENRFVLTAADKRFKTIVAMLMGAYYSDSPVRIHGTDLCNAYTGAEDLAYACLGSDPC